MFNDIVGRMAYGELQGEFDKIDKAKEWGYNVYYEVVEGKIVYDIDGIVDRMKKIASNTVEVAMVRILEKMKWHEIEYRLGECDYRKRAINENSKSMVVFLSVFADACVAVNCENEKLKEMIVGGLREFTEGECSFGALVGYGQQLAKLNLTEEFFGVCMDCIINMLLKCKI